MAGFDFDGESPSPQRRRQAQGSGLGIGIFVVVGLVVLAGLGGFGWWAVAERNRAVAAAGEQTGDKFPATRPKVQPPMAPLPDPSLARRQREQEAELERQREAAKAELEKQARKVELLRQLSDVDAAERRRTESLVALFASLQAYIPEAEAAVAARRQVVAKLQNDIRLGGAFGAPRMPGNPNTREALLDLHLQQLRKEEAALADAKSRLEQAEADFKAARAEADAERRRIRRELDS